MAHSFEKCLLILEVLETAQLQEKTVIITQEKTQTKNEKGGKLC